MPPTCAPRVPDEVIEAPTARDDVATEESAAVPFPYTSCEAVNVDTPVPPPATGRPVAFVRTRAEGVPRAGVTRVGEVARTTSPVPVHVKREEVAMAVTFAVAPVLLPRIVLAAICASLVSPTPLVASVSVELAPPMRAPIVPPIVNSAEGVKVVVATVLKDP